MSHHKQTHKKVLDFFNFSIFNQAVSSLLSEFNVTLPSDIETCKTQFFEIINELVYTPDSPEHAQGSTKIKNDSSSQSVGDKDGISGKKPNLQTEKFKK